MFTQKVLHACNFIPKSWEGPTVPVVMRDLFPPRPSGAQTNLCIIQTMIIFREKKYYEELNQVYSRTQKMPGPVVGWQWKPGSWVRGGPSEASKNSDKFLLKSCGKLQFFKTRLIFCANLFKSYGNN